MSVDTAAPRSRRAMLAGALSGLAGLIAGRMASPDQVTAAAGDPLTLGSAANNAGTAGTALTTKSAATGLYVYQNGSGPGIRANAVGPDSIGGFFTASNGTGVSGVTGRASAYGVYAANDSSTAGGGAALRANGKSNDGIVATTDNPDRVAVRASSPWGTAIHAEGHGVPVVVKGHGGAGLRVEAGDIDEPNAGCGAAVVIASEQGCGLGVDAQNKSNGGGFDAIIARVRGRGTAVNGYCTGEELGTSVGVRGLSYLPEGVGMMGEGRAVGVVGRDFGDVSIAGDNSRIGVHGIGLTGVRGTVNAAGNDVGRAVAGVVSKPSDYAGHFDGRVFVGAHVELAEVADPDSADPASARLYVRDDGSGKGQLCVRFSSGAIIVIATEP